MFSISPLSGKELVENVEASWVVVARQDADLDPWTGSGRDWIPCVSSSERALWTDDHVSLLPVLDW